MSISIAQIETTFDVEYQGLGYTVVRMEDINSGYISYDVFDEEADIVEGELEDEILTYLEENSN